MTKPGELVQLRIARQLDDLPPRRGRRLEILAECEDVQWYLARSQLVRAVEGAAGVPLSDQRLLVDAGLEPFQGPPEELGIQHGIGERRGWIENAR